MSGMRSHLRAVLIMHGSPEACSDIDKRRSVLTQCYLRFTSTEVGRLLFVPESSQEIPYSTELFIRFND